MEQGGMRWKQGKQGRALQSRGKILKQSNQINSCNNYSCKRVVSAGSMNAGRELHQEGGEISY